MKIAIPIVAIITLLLTIDYIRSVAARERMLAALRTENKRLHQYNHRLEMTNMKLRDEKAALTQQLSKAGTDNTDAELIAALQAEIRVKDKLLDQKWKTAKAVCAAVKR